MATRIRAFSWSATPLGAIRGWPQSLKTVVDLMLASPSMMSLVWGADAIHLYNDGFTELLREHRTTSLGRSAFETFARSREVFEADVAAGMAGKSARLLAQRYPVLRSGKLEDAWFDVDIVPVRDETGAVAGVLWTLKEVTAQVLAERDLRETETRHRLLIERWAQAVWETDPDGVVVADSPSWRDYTGQTLDEWLGYGWLDAIHPDDRAYAERQWREAVAAHSLVDTEFRLRAPDGGWRWTNVRAAPMLNEGGGTAKWVGLNIDVDARKRTEEELRQSEEKYRILFDTIDSGYAVVDNVRDEDGRVVDLFGIDFNRSYTLHSGLPPFAGRRASEVITVEPEWLLQFEEVARTGVPARHENYIPERDRWVSTHYSLVGDLGSDSVAVVFDDITDRKRAEIARRESEERQGFLLRFSDALRSEPDADAMGRRAIEMLSAHLKLDRCYITYYRPDEDIADVPLQFGNATVPPFPATIRLSDFPEAYQQVLDRTFVVEDDFERRGLSAAERANSTALGMRAMVASTIREGEKRPLASLAAVSSTPRKWTPAEVSLVEEVAERTWSAMEHARAEAALRASEERFRQFAAASAAGLWIREADTLSMEFASAAIGTIYGVESDTLLGDVRRWAAMVLPEDREIALDHLDQARRGETVAHEFRIKRPADGAFRWIRNTDFPLRDDGDIPRVGGIAEDVTETKLAVEHQRVLLAELQHRVRNIMAMIRSMARRSAGSAANVDDYRILLEGRLLALARVQALLTRQANAGGSLRDIVESEVAAQAHHGGQFELVGPETQLSPKAVEVLTLALHELATNALKYGALSVPEGRLRVEWAPLEKRGRTWLSIDWTETGAPSRGPAIRRGFGSDLIEGKIPYELGGTGKISIEADGAHCRLEFPLKEGESILETDAPTPTTVFGGTLDMTGAPDLTGRCVLVVEDDYYIAGDTAAALRGAGATVLGPCPSEDATLDLLETATPTHAVLDLNLGGGGPRFEIAHALKERGVPFVFLTGYDPDAVPDDLTGVVRLQKPVTFSSIVEAVAQL